MNNYSTTPELNMDNFEKTMNLLERTGLNWEVRKEPFTHSSGLATPYYGVFRYDNHSDEPTSCLGAVKDRYQVFQNWELADTIVRATDSIGITTDRGGMLKNGAKVYLQARLEDEYVGKSGVKRWITCVNSHDGSASIGFGSTNTVVVCENTFHQAYQESQKFRHTVSAKSRIEMAIAEFQKTINQDKKLFETFHIMADKAPTENLVRAVLDSMFAIESAKVTRDEISTRKSNQMNQFAEAYAIERQLEGDTVWGLFNAVTRYTNHMSGPANADSKANYLMAGTGYKINNNAYNTIMDWINENTSKKEFLFV